MHVSYTQNRENIMDSNNFAKKKFAIYLISKFY